MPSHNRDEKGRFIKGNAYRFNAKEKPLNEIQKIRDAFIAGLNSQGFIEKRPSVLADRYLKQQKLL